MGSKLSNDRESNARWIKGQGKDRERERERKRKAKREGGRKPGSLQYTERSDLAGELVPKEREKATTNRGRE